MTTDDQVAGDDGALISPTQPRYRREQPTSALRPGRPVSPAPTPTHTFPLSGKTIGLGHHSTSELVKHNMEHLIARSGADSALDSALSHRTFSSASGVSATRTAPTGETPAELHPRALKVTDRQRSPRLVAWSVVSLTPFDPDPLAR